MLQEQVSTAWTIPRMARDARGSAKSCSAQRLLEVPRSESSPMCAVWGCSLPPHGWMDRWAGCCAPLAAPLSAALALSLTVAAFCHQGFMNTAGMWRHHLSGTPSNGILWIKF